MILVRKLFSSKKLKDSRVGIGWTQDGNGKVDAEKYFRIGKQAADKAADEGKSDEEIIDAAKKAAGKQATLDNIGKPTWKTIKRGALLGGGVYIAAKNGEFIERQIHGMGLRNVNVPKEFLNKNANKLAIGAAVVGAGSVIAKEAPRVIKKRKAARLGAEINTEKRLKKN